LDYALLIDGEQQAYAFARWNGTAWEEAPHSTLEVDYAGGAFVGVNRSEVGGTSGFNFVVATVQGDPSAPIAHDLAPDAGAWNYQLAAADPAAGGSTTRAAVKLAVARVFTRPVAPVPGVAFTVFAEVTRSDTG